MSFSHCRRSVSVFFVSRFFKCDSLSFFLLFFCLFRPKSTSYSLSCFTVLRVGVFFHFSSSQFNVLSQTRCYFSPPFLLSVLLKYYRRGTSWCLVFLFFFSAVLCVFGGGVVLVVAVLVVVVVFLRVASSICQRAFSAHLQTTGFQRVSATLRSASTHFFFLLPFNIL